MKTKCIFLDIDGILNSIETCHYFYELSGGKNGYGGLFHPPTIPTLENILWGQKLVDNLKKIVDATDAKIVISSTWRMGHPWPTFIDMFKLYGWKDAPVIGATPIRHVKRGYEIKEYLDNHREVTNYVILDDSTDMLPEQMDNFVNTDENIGLSEKDADDAIKILNGE